MIIRSKLQDAFYYEFLLVAWSPLYSWLGDKHGIWPVNYAPKALFWETQPNPRVTPAKKAGQKLKVIATNLNTNTKVTELDISLSID